MEGNKRELERDVIKFYEEASSISQPLDYLKNFNPENATWEMCMEILDMYSSNGDRVSESNAELLMYCAVVVKLHAYNGFRQQLEGIEDHKQMLEDICQQVVELMAAYSKSQPQVSDLLSTVAACAVIYSFEASQTPDSLLFLRVLSKFQDGSLVQFQYLASVAREAMEQNIAIQLNHRCLFMRMCVTLAPQVMPKLIGGQREGELALDPVRMNTLKQWVQLHTHLLDFFHHVIMEQKFLEAHELVYEDMLVAKKKISDVEMVHSSLNSMYKLNVVEMILNFIKYGVASEDERVMAAAAELLLNVLGLCKVELSSLLMLASYKYYSYLTTTNSEQRWETACKYTLDRFSSLILQLIQEFVFGISRVAYCILECGMRDRRMPFLKEHTSRWLLEVVRAMAHAHLPLVLHFKLVRGVHVENICRFVNLYLYSDNMGFRRDALEFWSTFQSHLCPRRSELTFSNTALVENTRLVVVRLLRPCYELCMAELYATCKFKEGDDYEFLNEYREEAVGTMGQAMMITGPEFVLRMIRNDLGRMEHTFDVNVADRCVFVTSVLASRLTSGTDVVARVLLMALDTIDFKKLLLEKGPWTNFYRRSVFRLILWTGAFIAKHEELLSRTVQFLEDQTRVSKALNMTMKAHVALDKAVLGMCFSMEAEDARRKALVEYMTSNVTRYVFPLNNRIEVLESLLALVDTFPEQEAVGVRHAIARTFFNKVRNAQRIKDMPECYLFVVVAMSAINFVNEKELRGPVVHAMVKFMKKLSVGEELWWVMSEVLTFVSFVDMSGDDFSTNTVKNNKTSFVHWLFANQKPGFTQLGLVRTLLHENLVQAQTKLAEQVVGTVEALCEQLVASMRGGDALPDHLALELLECVSTVLARWELFPRFLEWHGLPEFVDTLATALPSNLGNMNCAIFGVVARFVGLANIPKQLLTPTAVGMKQRFKIAKQWTRSILTNRAPESKHTVVYTLVDAVFRAALARADQMEEWITPAAQTLTVLTHCKKLRELAIIAIREVMEERCKEMCKTHSRFYSRKMREARSANDVEFLLRIVSDYHNCRFNIY